VFFFGGEIAPIGEKKRWGGRQGHTMYKGLVLGKESQIHHISRGRKVEIAIFRPQVLVCQKKLYSFL
jgi:hypothetical protein